MARIHGRRGRLYVAIASGGNAEPIAYLSGWDISFANDRADVTAQGDNNKVFVAGLPDASGSYNGWYDTATAQLYTAARDGVERKFYLYPTTENTGQYWYGTALFDFTVSEGVDGGAAINGTFQAASDVVKIG